MYLIWIKICEEVEINIEAHLRIVPPAPLLLSCPGLSFSVGSLDPDPSQSQSHWGRDCEKCVLSLAGVGHHHLEAACGWVCLPSARSLLSSICVTAGVTSPSASSRPGLWCLSRVVNKQFIAMAQSGNKILTWENNFLCRYYISLENF